MREQLLGYCSLKITTAKFPRLIIVAAMMIQSSLFIRFNITVLENVLATTTNAARTVNAPVVARMIGPLF